MFWQRKNVAVRIGQHPKFSARIYIYIYIVKYEVGYVTLSEKQTYSSVILTLQYPLNNSTRFFFLCLVQMQYVIYLFLGMCFYSFFFCSIFRSK